MRLGFIHPLLLAFGPGWVASTGLVQSRLRSVQVEKIAERNNGASPKHDNSIFLSGKTEQTTIARILKSDGAYAVEKSSKKSGKKSSSNSDAYAIEKSSKKSGKKGSSNSDGSNSASKEGKRSGEKKSSKKSSKKNSKKSSKKSSKEGKRKSSKKSSDRLVKVSDSTDTDGGVTPDEPIPSSPPVADPIEDDLGGRLETPEPSYPPTLSPTPPITDAPTDSPTEGPTPAPTTSPTVAPVVIGIETLAPSLKGRLDVGEETLNPTSAPVVIDIETLAPSLEGRLDVGEETLNPTATPTGTPTGSPTATPTGSPTATPTGTPSSAPTEFASTVQRRLEQYALQGGEEFKDPSSYQSSALQRVEEQVGAESMSDEKLVQYYSLYCIFVSTNGVPNAITALDSRFDGIDIPAWDTTTGWTGIDLDPCDEWFGVHCEDDEVIELYLYNNGMTGIFPAEATLLASDGASATGAGSLWVLDISDNNFLFNDYDSSWMEFLGTSLEYLYFESTAFAGNLPKFPVGLMELDASYTLISGGLDDANFAGLIYLEILDLNGLAFNQPIPETLASLPSLAYFFISDSQITGDISYIAFMTSIREHWIDYNPDLTGPIYSFTGGAITLESLSISACGLTGTIPSQLGKLPVIQEMRFSENRLVGTIPASLGNLILLRKFQVEGNDLVGAIPEAYCADTRPVVGFDTLGADCLEVDCPCCTCCGVLECREESAF